MKTFIAFAMVLCLSAGVWLLQGPTFFWPDRHQPSQGVLLGPGASRVLGAGLLLVAGCGAMVVRQAGKGSGRAAPREWQRLYFTLIMLALALIGTAFTMGDRGPNPDSRPHRPPGAMRE